MKSVLRKVVVYFEKYVSGGTTSENLFEKLIFEKSVELLIAKTVLKKFSKQALSFFLKKQHVLLKSNIFFSSLPQEVNKATKQIKISTDRRAVNRTVA